MDDLFVSDTAAFDVQRGARLVACCLLVTISAVLAGCDQEQNAGEPTSAATTTVAAPEPTMAPEPTAVPEPAATPEPEASSTPRPASTPAASGTVPTAAVTPGTGQGGGQSQGRARGQARREYAAKVSPLVRLYADLLETLDELLEDARQQPVLLSDESWRAQGMIVRAPTPGISVAG
ncbi:MAG: hypothetical protein CL878_12620 [Dehalococcoidia bacterium]|nr:hypothetical protein [Dehalococcoidia bacterium]